MSSSLPGVEPIPQNMLLRARMLRVLMHPLGLRIAWALSQREMCVNELVAQVASVTSSRVSQYLALLREQGLVISRRDRNWIRYRLADAQVRQWVVDLNISRVPGALAPNGEAMADQET
ncbi:ArsR/SmtB family transcription factor [Silvimonas soli]|uniref:ArsR/SmtB family transcription factor n=1 Tax=Silvimonas soli TaxID=2980100 RepID=UPI0024B3C352|nr:metalloregulator ArsR/SmtB family transcription factor [Silvimonas soli]